MTVQAQTPAPAPWLPLRRDLPREHGFEPLRVVGRLPPELAGTLYRNGPGFHIAPDAAFQHIFDRDGAISAVRLDGGSAHGAARVLDSEGQRRERRDGRVRFGGFKARPPGFLWQVATGRIKNVANTHVIPHGDELLALFEFAPPTRVDPETLATLGPTDLGGAVPGAFSAHPHRVAARAATYNFGLRLSWLRNQLDLFELPDAGAPRRLTTLPLPGVPWLHDFVATERHAVFFVSPVHLRADRLLLGGASFGDALEWRPDQGTEVIVVPLDAPHTPRRFRVDPFYQWHFANAWEEDGLITVDFIRYEDFSTSAWLEQIFHGPTEVTAPGRLTRAVIDPEAETVVHSTLYPAPVEFPRVAPAVEGARHRYVYSAAHADDSATRRGLQDRLVRVDTRTGDVAEWRAGSGRYVNEPVFAPGGGGEEEGWVLAPVYDAARDATFLAVLDAGDVVAGPVAEVWFDHRLPMTFHGSWVPAG